VLHSSLTLGISADELNPFAKMAAFSRPLQSTQTNRFGRPA